MKTLATIAAVAALSATAAQAADKTGYAEANGLNYYYEISRR
jgi:opacity protein-like surface antigen